MANKKYPKYAEALLRGGANLESGTVKVALIDLGVYTYNDAHEFFSSVSGVVGTPVEVTGKTFVNGLFDATVNPTFSAVTGNTAEALILYIDTTNPATSRLLIFMDTDIGGIPVTPNGGDINLTWNASGIFQI